MSLRLRFSLIIGTLSVFLIAVCAWIATTSIARIQAASELREHQALADELSVMAGNMAVERGLTQGVIGNSGKADSGRQVAILERREKVLAAAEMLTATGIASTGMHIALTINEMEDKRANVMRLRAQVDDMLREQKISAPGLRAEWFGAATQYIRAISDVRHVIQTSSAVNEDTTALFDAQHTFASLAELVGQERGRLNGYVASGMPMFPNETTPLRIIAGSIDIRLTDVKAVKRRLNEEVAVQVSDAIEHYKTEMAIARDKIISDGLAGRDYAFTDKEWFALATGAIQKIIAANKSISEDIFRNADKVEADSMWSAFLAFGAILLSLIAIGMAFWASRQYLEKPIASLVDVMSRLSDGDLEVFVPEHKGSTEMEAMAKAVYHFKQNARQNERYRKEQEEFKAQTVAKQRKVMMDVADRFETEVGGVSNDIVANARELASNAAHVSKTAEESADRGRSMRDKAVETEADLGSVVGAAQELTSTITEVSGQVSGAARQATDTSEKAKHAADKVAQLNEASSRIKEVVSLISDIAEQTNLLALNATIEAARAGDQGKGFAVVASEVKNLANQTQKATEEIAGQITSMLTEITDTSNAVTDITDLIETVNATIQSIAAAAEEQSATTAEMASTLENASQRMQNVRAEAEEMSELAASTGSAVAQVASAAGGLSETGNSLERESTHFLEQIRSSDKAPQDEKDEAAAA